MNKLITGSFLVAMLAVPTFVLAVDSNTGNLTVTGTVESSISLTIESVDGTPTGEGSDAVSTALGTISKYGTAPTGFTITNGAGNWTLSSDNGIGIKVVKANLVGTVYTLSAKLSTPPGVGVIWTVGAITANATTPQTIGSGVAYDSTVAYAWSVLIPDTLATTTSIGNTIEFSAVSA